MNIKLLIKEKSLSRIFLCNELWETIYKYLPYWTTMRLNITCQCCLGFIFNKTNINVQFYLCNIFDIEHKEYIREIRFDKLITYITKDIKYTLDTLFSGRYVMSYCDGNDILTLCHSTKKKEFIEKVYFPKDKLINRLKQIQSKIV